MFQRRLYLYGGQTFVLVPESAWLTELKAHPCGVTALKSVDDMFINKGWVKLQQVRDPDSHAVSTEWLFEETGIRLNVAVDASGELKVGDTVVGQTPIAGTHRQLEKVAENAAKGKGKWITVTHEKTDAMGNKIVGRRRVYIPPDKVRQEKVFVSGAGTRQPEKITRVRTRKGGPHPTTDIMTSQKGAVMSQLIGTYSLPLLKQEKPTRAEATALLSQSGKLRRKNPKKAKELARRAFKIFHQLKEAKKAEAPEDLEEILRACNLMLELAEEEKNERERELLCKEVERLLERIEGALPQRGTGLQTGRAESRRGGKPRTEEERRRRHRITAGTMYPYPEAR